MIVNEKCSNWKLTYEHDSANVESTQVYSDLLHTVGDMISVLVGLYEKEPAILDKVIGLIYGYLHNFREETQMGINFAIAKFGLDKELVGEFANDKLFGKDIKDSLRASLRNDEEQELASEYLDADSEEGTDEDN